MTTVLIIMAGAALLFGFFVAVGVLKLVSRLRGKDVVVKDGISKDEAKAIKEELAAVRGEMMGTAEEILSVVSSLLELMEQKPAPKRRATRKRATTKKAS